MHFPRKVAKGFADRAGWFRVERYLPYALAILWLGINAQSPAVCEKKLRVFPYGGCMSPRYRGPELHLEHNAARRTKPGSLTGSLTSSLAVREILRWAHRFAELHAQRETTEIS